jgi:hypothetical protein
MMKVNVPDRRTRRIEMGRLAPTVTKAAAVGLGGEIHVAELAAEDQSLG